MGKKENEKTSLRLKEKKIVWKKTIALCFLFLHSRIPYLDDLADVGAGFLQELELLAEEADCLFVCWLL